MRPSGVTVESSVLSATRPLAGRGVRSTLIGLALIAPAFLLGLIVGRGWQDRAEPEPQEDEVPFRSHIRRYPYIHPLLEVNTTAKKVYREAAEIEARIKATVDELVRNDGTERISVYFQDFESGMWAGVHETLDYAPASMLKVPILIAYYKWAETDPAVLQRTIRYEKELVPPGLNTNVLPERQIRLGESYTIDDLLKRMIVHSDNNAAQVLFNAIDRDALLNVSSDLGIPPAADRVNMPDSLSPKNYSLFFRVLYNSTYLTPEMSSRALALLTETDFKDGLVAGVPQGITVSHKYGNRYSVSPNGKPFYQLHDCGIVYYPEHPYVLTVMSRGSSYEELTAGIKRVSAVVYEEVDRRFAPRG